MMDDMQTRKEKASFVRFSHEQIAKIGNSLIYLAEKIEGLSKTKALKLMYILDELAIRQSGIPFFNLRYKVWKFGPVSEEIFIDLSSEPSLLKDYIERTSDEGVTTVKPIKPFEDDEFSDYEIELMDYVVKTFGGKTAKELVRHTHRKQSPWNNAAKKHQVLELLNTEQINSTDFEVDMSDLIDHDERKKSIYTAYLESH